MKNNQTNTHPLPLYTRFWNQLKRFPRVLAVGSKNTPSVSGTAAAALVSASFSCFMLMVNQHLTSIFKAWNTIIWNLGDWIPGSKTGDPIYGEIGSYTGKQTIMLISWILSWIVLHQLWKKKEVSFNVIFFCLFGFLVAATVMNWHPIFPYLPLMPK